MSEALRKKTGELWIESSKVGRKCGNLHVSLASLQHLSAENCNLPSFHIEKAKYLRQKVWIKSIKYNKLIWYIISNISLFQINLKVCLYFTDSKKVLINYFLNLIVIHIIFLLIHKRFITSLVLTIEITSKGEYQKAFKTLNWMSKEEEGETLTREEKVMRSKSKFLLARLMEDSASYESQTVLKTYRDVCCCFYLC